ncbi:MAG: helix-turn-helix domain-containing protein [Ruminococcus sp.]|nr:helix-turn-helix domain-containing protein [Ruminococcus sp.]
MTMERKAELAKQLVAIIFELTSAGEVPVDVMPEQQHNKPVEMLTLKESLDVIPGLSMHTLRQLVLQGKIKSVRCGAGVRGKILIAKNELLSYFES